MKNTAGDSLRTARLGSDPYDGASANGWYVVQGDGADVEAVAGPYLDNAVASRHLNEIRNGSK